jgi:hypothetical protein
VCGAASRSCRKSATKAQRLLRRSSAVKTVDNPVDCRCKQRAWAARAQRMPLFFLPFFRPYFVRKKCLQLRSPATMLGVEHALEHKM